MPPSVVVAEDQHAKREPSGYAYMLSTASVHAASTSGTRQERCVLCQASRSSLNGECAQTLVIRVAAHRVILCHRCMPPCRVPGPVCRGDGIRQTPAPATTYCIVHYMSSQGEFIAIPLMCRYNCEAALTGHGHGMTDSPKPVRKATLLLSPCLSASFSYHSPLTRLRKAWFGVTCRLERIRMCSTSAN